MLRLDVVQRLGAEEIMTALGRPPLAVDETGELFGIGPEPRPSLLVKVRDPAGDLDGVSGHHWLPVPPHVASAHEAVAWSLAGGGRHYRPGIEG